jgi:hypothetical protein
MFHPFDLLLLIVFLRNSEALPLKNPWPSLRRSMSHAKSGNPAHAISRIWMSNGFEMRKNHEKSHSIICHPLVYHGLSLVYP